jgi:hypothetical protein
MLRQILTALLPLGNVTIEVATLRRAVEFSVNVSQVRQVAM